MEELFSTEQRDGSLIKKITTTESSFLINDGKGSFSLIALPYQAQFSPIHAIETGDFDADGHVDILLAGNFFDSLPEWGRFDANYGLLLKGLGKGKFKSIMSKDSGFRTRGQVRKMVAVKSVEKSIKWVLAKNNDPVQVFSLKK
jgi:hypothetical protein